MCFARTGLAGWCSMDGDGEGRAEEGGAGAPRRWGWRWRGSAGAWRRDPLGRTAGTSGAGGEGLPLGLVDTAAERGERTFIITGREACP